MSSNRDKGFAFLPVITVVGLVAILAVGWYVWHKQNNSAGKTVSSFAECTAAGNPVQESYPEVCVTKDGQRFVNPNQTAQAPPMTTSDETTSWLLYSAEDKTYTVRIPDGWKLVSLNGNLYGRDDGDIIFHAGTKATVTATEGGWDGPSAFSFYNPGAYASQIVRQGNEQATLTTAQGLTVHKYYYTQTQEPEAIGYQKDAKVYNYYFDADGKYLQIGHVINPGQTDQTALIEKLVKTIQVN